MTQDIQEKPLNDRYNEVKVEQHIAASEQKETLCQEIEELCKKLQNEPKVCNAMKPAETMRLQNELKEKHRTINKSSCVGKGELTSS